MLSRRTVHNVSGNQHAVKRNAETVNFADNAFKVFFSRFGRVSDMQIGNMGNIHLFSPLCQYKHTCKDINLLITILLI